MKWNFYTENGQYLAGFIPQMLSEKNPEPAVKQLNNGYQHGGGWRPFIGFKMKDDRLLYPDDPPLSPVAECKFRDERILVYRFGWVAVVQKDGSFEVCRMD